MSRSNRRRHNISPHAQGKLSALPPLGSGSLWSGLGALALIVGLTVALLSGCACGEATTPQGAATAAEDTVLIGEAVAVSSVAVTLLDVVDGDTIWVRMPDGTAEKVRYIGIDAPEVAHRGVPGEYLGDEASAHNAELLASGSLHLEMDVDERDDYGRLLAYVWAGGVCVNERLVLDGYARAHDYPPNLAHQQELWDAQHKARKAGVGIWAGQSE